MTFVLLLISDCVTVMASDELLSEYFPLFYSEALRVTAVITALCQQVTLL